MEVLIVIALIVILATIAILALNPRTQLQKARDARRKSDLEKVQNKLESYFTDKGNYPTISCADSECCQILTKDDPILSPYLNKIPGDPSPSKSYLFCSAPTRSQWFKIYTNIENTADFQLSRNPCRTGCYKQSNFYNYVVMSPNILTSEESGFPPEGSQSIEAGCARPNNYCPPAGINPACCSGTDGEGQQLTLWCQEDLYWCDSPAD